MFGLLVLNKPAGLTSRDAVNRVQRLIRPVKVGHAGTLDPIATGVLVLCLGPATRLITRVQQMPKQYVGAFLLGCTSPSDDIELTPEPLLDPRIPTLEEIRQAIPAFVGQIQQTPPAYSAVKVSGQKAYQRARRGEAVELPPRPVTVYDIQVVRYQYPELELAISCGSGTYIRSLGRDLATTLGTGAVMCGLTRSAIGPFELADAVAVEGLTIEQVRAGLLPPLKALPDITHRAVSEAEIDELRHGRPIALTCDKQAAAVSETGKLVALLTPKRGEYWPSRVFKDDGSQAE